MWGLARGYSLARMLFLSGVFVCRQWSVWV